MNVTISFSQSEESYLAAVARQTGLAPAELIKRITLENLPPLTPSPLSVSEENDAIDAKLRLWQQKEGTPLMPDRSTADLYAEWEQEDARVTDEERDAEDRLWAEIEKELLKK